ncbi:MAG: hypothetical protein PUD44_12135 [Clostridiaceae bacterium]|nr:hypothetical protein [Clostridiaceae bacterium]
MAYVNPVPFRKNGFETTQTRRLYRMMLKFLKFPAANFHTWDKRPNCGYFFTGCYWYGTDQNDMAALMGFLLRFGEFDEQLAGVSAERVREMGIQALRYACFTHDTGPEDCVRVMGRNTAQSGTKWGGNHVTWPGPRNRFFQSSQVGSGMVFFGLAAWFLWDYLDEETRQMAYNVLTDYAERWAEHEPRDGTYFNTQSEENGWTGAGIFAAAVLFRDDPRAGKWREGALRWMVDSDSTPLDMYNTEVLPDGVPLRRRLDHITLHPDFTNENHGVVHPDYLAAPLAFHTEMQLFADLAGEGDIPGLTHNWREIYDRVFKLCSASDGGALPVQSQDWFYLKNGAMMSIGSLTAAMFDDPEAAYLEKLCLDTLEATQNGHSNGTFVANEPEQVVNRGCDQILADFEPGIGTQLMIPYLIHYCRGEGPAPVSKEAFECANAVVRNFPFGGSVAARTPGSFSVFSYRNSALAAVLPDDKLWTVTIPPCSMFGTIRFAGDGGKAVFPPNLDRILSVSDLRVSAEAQDYAASLSVDRGGMLHQTVAAVALPDGRVVFFQRARALEDCVIADFAWGLTGIRNEYYTFLPEYAKGYRDLYINDAPPVRMEGRIGGEDRLFDFPDVRYAAIDDRMAYLLHGSAVTRYVGHHDYPKWKGIEDFLILNERENTALVKGEELPRFIAVCLPNTGIDGAREASRTFSVSEDGCVDAVMLDGLLVFASRQDTACSAEARFATDAARVPLFEGSTRFENGQYRWNAALKPRECGYKKAAAWVGTERSFEAAVLPDGRVLIRYDGETAFSVL